MSQLARSCPFCSRDNGQRFGDRLGAHFLRCGDCRSVYRDLTAGTRAKPELKWVLANRGLPIEERRKWVARFGTGARGTVVVAGTGSGWDLASWGGLNPRLLVGTDFYPFTSSWASIADAVGNESMSVVFFRSSLEHIPLADGSVDVVVSDAVYEHCQNLRAVLDETSRVVRPGGLLYATYGPMLTLTFSLGGEVYRFAAVETASRWSFGQMNGALSIPEPGRVFGLGGPRRSWIPPVEAFVASLEQRGMKLRYGGTFVGDYNQILRYGGIFGYPALRDRPRGKLRVLYEAAPMSFITERAGGAASDGSVPILSIDPKELAETTPVYLGTSSLVRELESLISPAVSSSR